MERHRDLGNIHSCRWIGICHARKRDGTLPQRFTAQMMASVPGGHLNVQRTLLVGHHIQEPWHRCRSCFLRRDNIRCRMLHVVQMNSLTGEWSRRWVRRVLRGTGNDLRNGGLCRSAHQRSREVVITLLACVHRRDDLQRSGGAGNRQAARHMRRSGDDSDRHDRHAVAQFFGRAMVGFHGIRPDANVQARAHTGSAVTPRAWSGLLARSASRRCMAVDRCGWRGPVTSARFCEGLS